MREKSVKMANFANQVERNGFMLDVVVEVQNSQQKPRHPAMNLRAMKGSNIGSVERSIEREYRQGV